MWEILLSNQQEGDVATTNISLEKIKNKGFYIIKPSHNTEKAVNTNRIFNKSRIKLR